MKKSQIYHMAMLVIADSHCVSAGDKVEMIVQLNEDKKVAKYLENEEAKKQEEKKEAENGTV